MRDVTRLWRETFTETHVVTADGRDDHLRRFFDSLPLDPALVTVDRCAPGVDCARGVPHPNHHVIVGNRHKRLVEGARRRRSRNVFVFEDDAEFVDRDTGALEGALTWARAHEDLWDVFYLGFLAPLFSTCAPVARHVVRPSRPFHAHALCYAAPAYDAVLGIDLGRDHRPQAYRLMERIVSPGGRRDPYFRDGVGSLDTWLSFSRLRRYAAHPVQVVQHSLPPGTEAGWRRRTGRPYAARETPRTLVRLAIVAHYLRWAAVAGVLAMAAAAVRRC